MATPIQPTPTLNKEEFVRLLKRMRVVERRKKPTKSDQFFIDAILANSKKDGLQ